MSIPIQISRGLVDKSYEKRKASALQLESYVRELIISDHKDPITYILLELSNDYLTSSKESVRAGATMGLATCGIALGTEYIADYLDLILPPILSSLTDNEPKLRYYGCEALYNVSKVARGLILGYFNQLIDMLSRVISDPAPNVKDSANYLDRLIKDIVADEATNYLLTQASLQQSSSGEPSNDTSPTKSTFSLDTFVPLLAERMHTFKAATRLYLIEWIRILDTVPGLDLVEYLPSFLDQLIRFLSDPKGDVRLKASNALSELLREVEECADVEDLVEELWNEPQKLDSSYDSQNRKDSSTFANPLRRLSVSGYTAVNSVGNASKELKMAARRSKIRNERRDFSGNSSSSFIQEYEHLNSVNKDIYVDHAACLNILLIHLHSNDQEILATALNWVGSFTFICPNDVINLTPQLIHAILPLSSHTIPDICSMALRINDRLQELVCYELQANYPAKFHPSFCFPQLNIQSTAIEQNQSNEFNLFKSGLPPTNDNNPELLSNPKSFAYDQVVSVIVLLFENNVNESTKVEGLKWLILLNKCLPFCSLSSEGISFSFLLNALNDSSENVVKLVLKLFAQIALSADSYGKRFNEPLHLTTIYISKFIGGLLALFFDDQQLLNDRLSLIIRQLCSVINPETIFRLFAFHICQLLISQNLYPKQYFDLEHYLDSNNTACNDLSKSVVSTSHEIYNNPTKLDVESSIIGGINNINLNDSASNLYPPALKKDYLEFSQNLIGQLTWILVCSKETFHLRKVLSGFSNNNNSNKGNLTLSFLPPYNSQHDYHPSFNFSLGTSGDKKLPGISSNENTTQIFNKPTEATEVDASKTISNGLLLNIPNESSRIPPKNNALSNDSVGQQSINPAPKDEFPNILHQTENNTDFKPFNIGHKSPRICLDSPKAQNDLGKNNTSLQLNGIKSPTIEPKNTVNKATRFPNKLSRLAKKQHSRASFSPSLNSVPKNKSSAGSVLASTKSESPFAAYPSLLPTVSQTVTKDNIRGNLDENPFKHDLTSSSFVKTQPNNNSPQANETFENHNNKYKSGIQLHPTDSRVKGEYPFPSQMSSFNPDIESPESCWSVNPVSTLILCFLAHQYELAYNIIVSLTSNEISLNLLKDLDRLVQLLESPTFSFMRIQLLNQKKYPYLVGSLYGILMILPQSTAFVMLKNRLSTLVNVPLFNDGLPDFFQNTAEYRTPVKSKNLSTERQANQKFSSNNKHKETSNFENRDQKNIIGQEVATISEHLNNQGSTLGLFKYYINIQSFPDV
ncbi:hypothetical protein BB560_000920 [Smittium megazygosporum]|uniref:Vacuolar protein 14 C-terminal Fig4-binding domain-containing protein n=1 Tax=Smittium megazygosporum TaxID=133381 RepID=A0A2T9ZJ84_9FUNG|nr:hypothetical protein BB560_000920 [Smittium megazygosporum]